MLLGIGDTDEEGKAIAARGLRGLMRRVVEVHTFDRLALDEHQAEAALNPLARGAQALMAPGGEDLAHADADRRLRHRSAGHRTAASAARRGALDYVILQLPTGDMTFEESRDTLERFIADVMPKLR